MFRAIPLVVLLSTMLLSSPVAAEVGPALAWRDWNEGIKEASRSNRPVLVDVYTDWCGWCKRMDRDVYTRNDVRDYLARRFVTIRLNAEAGKPAKFEGREFTSRSLASRFRVTGYPTTIFLRPEGEHLANVPGYIPADRFMLLLRYVGDGYLDRGVTFDEFKKTVAAETEAGAGALR